MKFPRSAYILCKKAIIVPGLCLIALSANAQQPASEQAAKEDSLQQDAPAFLKEIIEDIEAENSKSSSYDLEIDGLIVDATVTKAGRDFYQVFYNNWQAPPNAKNFSIEIKEKPSRGLGTIVSIDVNDRQVIEIPLQPRYDIIESMAEQAVRSIYGYLQNYEQIQQQLSGDDLSGSGIY